MAKKFDLMTPLLISGGFVAGKAVNKLPFIKDQNNLVRAGAKVALGYFGPKMVKGDVLEKIGLGLMVSGIHEAVGQFVPAIAGVPYAQPMLLREGSLGALESQGLGALEGEAELAGPGRATL